MVYYFLFEEFVMYLNFDGKEVKNIIEMVVNF